MTHSETLREILEPSYLLRTTHCVSRIPGMWPFKRGLAENTTRSRSQSSLSASRPGSQGTLSFTGGNNKKLILTTCTSQLCRPLIPLEGALRWVEWHKRHMELAPVRAFR